MSVRLPMNELESHIERLDDRDEIHGLLENPISTVDRSNAWTERFAVRGRQ